MKSLPTHAMIRGLDWQIKRVPGTHPAIAKDENNPDRPYYGLCDKYGEYGGELTMYVNKNSTLQVQWETLWHEVFHAISWGFKPFNLKHEMPIEILAGEVLSLCRQWDFL